MTLFCSDTPDYRHFMSNTKQSPALTESPSYKKLFEDIVQLIKQGRQRVATEVNSTTVLLYWSIGKRINDEVLQDKRAEYGEQVIHLMSHQLTLDFGKGYSRSGLFRMVRFAKFFPEAQIVATLSRQLSWSHVILLCQMEDELPRNFYMQMACIENWDVRTLRKKKGTMLFERTVISKQPEEVIRNELEKLAETQQLTPEMVFRDPCFLDFMGLPQKYSEFDLEDAILDHILEFIQEIGTDFCLVARQKRMSTKNTDRYLDLLFFHRGMRRLVAVELKLDRFEPEHKGQMEWYLRWLDKNERKPGEEKPLGIILCASKDQEDVEYLELDQAGIHVAQYFTELPSKTMMEEKLHAAITMAKQNHEIKRLLQNKEK
jgi:predicted nuclease of restriction endonuclease-like (RecB) superfamily